MSPRFFSIVLATLGAGLTTTSAMAQDLSGPADLAIVQIAGPGPMTAGLSGTFRVTIENRGGRTAPVELFIIFAGALDQTGQIVPGAGLACEVVHDAGINAAVRCTGGVLGRGQSTTVVVQGRGSAGGIGKMVATINPSQAAQETNFNNNLVQLDVNIR